MAINHRYEFVYLFDVKDGNPNGDPMPGIFLGLIRKQVMGLSQMFALNEKSVITSQLSKGQQTPYEIYVKEKGILEDEHITCLCECWN